MLEAGPGDLVSKPRGEWHTFWNAGWDEPCRILETIAPAGFEGCFAALVDLGGPVERPRAHGSLRRALPRRATPPLTPPGGLRSPPPGAVRRLRSPAVRDNVCGMPVSPPAPPARRRATLVDVAAGAGVSVSTASRALRNHPRVSPVTRHRIAAIAETLGFAPNDSARSLRTRASMLVGMVLPDVAIPFYAAALKGAQGRLEQAGYEVLVMNTDRQPARERRALRTLQSRQVDAVLVATSGGYVALDVPVVFFDHVLAGAGDGAVVPDNAAGVAALVDHLAADHGHERIAFLGAPSAPAPDAAVLEGGPAHERLEAFRAAMGRRGMPIAPEHVVLGDHGWSEAGAAAATAQLLVLASPPTAILAAGDTLALGALRALRGAGRVVPGEIALVSFDDPVDADLMDPPMTALGRHDRDLGTLAAEFLLGALDGEPPPPGPRRLALELVLRRSCGCPEPQR